LSNDLYAVMLATGASMTDESLFRLVGGLGRLPDTDLPGMPNDTKGTDFLEHIEGYAVMVNGQDVILDAYMPSKHENLMGMPEGIGYLVISTQQSSLVGMPDQYDAFLKLLQEAFIGQGALYAFTIQEYELTSGEVGWKDLRSHVGGVHLFSREVVEALGRERILTRAPEGGVLRDGGVWLRFQEEYFYGMPLKYHERMTTLLEEMWERLGMP